jgi:hypothetical protein
VNLLYLFDLSLIARADEIALDGTEPNSPSATSSAAAIALHMRCAIAA